MKDEQQILFDVRDRRETEWFWVDNEFIDKCARNLGPVATLVYVALARHSNNNNQACFPSMQTIANEVGLKSRNTVAGGIKELEKNNVIKTEENIDHRTGRRLNNVYTLLHKKFWNTNLFASSSRKKENKKPSVELPEWLDKKSWSEWVIHRKEIKKSLTPMSMKKQIKLLENDKANHVEIIQNSIRNGWTGLFLLNPKQKTQVLNAVEGKYSKFSK